MKLPGSTGRYSMIFFDPGYKPTPALPVSKQVKPVRPDPPFPLDREIVKFLRDQPVPVSPWTMAKGVADARNPASRSERRELTLQIFSRITRLIHHWYVRRVGRNLLTYR